MKQQLAERQEAGIISEAALPYERLDKYFHNEDCLAQISWDVIKLKKKGNLTFSDSYIVQYMAGWKLPLIDKTVYQLIKSK